MCVCVCVCVCVYMVVCEKIEVYFKIALFTQWNKLMSYLHGLICCPNIGTR